jgi:hypothetical protein
LAWWGTTLPTEGHVTGSLEVPNERRVGRRFLSVELTRPKRRSYKKGRGRDGEEVMKGERDVLDGTDEPKESQNGEVDVKSYFRRKQY